MVILWLLYSFINTNSELSVTDAKVTIKVQCCKALICVTQMRAIDRDIGQSYDTPAGGSDAAMRHNNKCILCTYGIGGYAHLAIG